MTGPPGVELAAEGLDALAESRQAAAGPGQCRGAVGRVAVLDAHGEAAPAVVDADDDANLRTRRVPERVREALLDHAEGQVRDWCRDLITLALEPAADVEPAACSTSDDLVDE